MTVNNLSFFCLFFTLIKWWPSKYMFFNLFCKILYQNKINILLFICYSWVNINFIFFFLDSFFAYLFSLFKIKYFHFMIFLNLIISLLLFTICCLQKYAYLILIKFYYFFYLFIMIIVYDNLLLIIPNQDHSFF